MKIPALVWICVLHCPQANYKITPGSIQRLPNELTASQSYSIARQFVNEAGIRVESDANVGLNSPRRDCRYWDVVWNEASVQINSVTGKITSISNSQKDNDIRTGRQSTAPFAISSLQQAGARITELFRLSGAPANFELEDLKIYDIPSGGHATAIAKIRIRSKRILGVYSHIMIDRLDGQLISVDQSWDYAIETEQPSLSAATAQIRAEQLYFAHRVESDRYPMDSTVPELAYVQRLDNFGSIRADQTLAIPRYRISYIVKFGPDRVHVDAVTGGSMGGVISTDRPH